MWLNDTDRLPLIRKKGAAELVAVMLQVLWWVLTHISPNCRDSLCGLEITNIPSRCLQFCDSDADGFCERCFCSADILKSMCAYSLTFFPSPPCFVSCAAADIISTVEFNSSGELLATGDKGGRVVVFQREQEVGNTNNATLNVLLLKGLFLKIFFYFVCVCLCSTNHCISFHRTQYR